MKYNNFSHFIHKYKSLLNSKNKSEAKMLYLLDMMEKEFKNLSYYKKSEINNFFIVFNNELLEKKFDYIKKNEESFNEILNILNKK